MDETNVMALTVAVVGAVATLFVIFVLPIWVFGHFWAKSRQNRGVTPEMEKMLEDMWRRARDMDRRMQSLETILDAETPHWRRDVARANADRTRDTQ